MEAQSRRQSPPLSFLSSFFLLFLCADPGIGERAGGRVQRPEIRHGRLRCALQQRQKGRREERRVSEAECRRSTRS